jgi:PAS domain S-box-containing protein
MRLHALKLLRENFSIKVFFAFAVFIFIISASFTLFFINRQTTSLKGALIRNGRLLASVLSYNSRIGVFAENRDLLRVPVEGVLHQEEVIEVSVFNLEGELLMKRERPEENATKGGSERDKMSMDGIFKEVRESGSLLFIEGDREVEFWSPVISTSAYSAEESLFFEEFPLQRKGRVIGFVRVTVGKDLLNKRLTDLLFKSIVIGIIFLIIGSGVTYLVVRGITKPLNRLTEGVKALGMGGVVNKVHIETEDEIGRLANAFNDMSESLKTRERALRESEERYKELADSITDVFFAMDNNLQYIYWNKASEELTGIAAGDAIGKSLREVFPDVLETRKAEKVYLDVLREQKPRSFINEYQLRGKDFTFEINVYPSRTGVSVYAKDITERKRAEQELMRSQEQLRNLADHLQSVREEERTNIAREIHDELGQSLTGLKMDLSWLAKKIPKDQVHILEKIGAMSKLSSSTLKTVQRMSAELRPGLLDDLGLVAAIEWQAEEFQGRTDIQCTLTVDPDDIALDDKRSTALFRIFQETLTNVARHAKATRVNVGLKEKGGTVELRVRDNGTGITEEQISDPRSFGILGIRERVHPWGGEVKVSGRKGKGTTVTVIIPLDKEGGNP